jgi:hypothetical protein
VRWTVAAIVIGPLLGLAAYLGRRGSARERAVAAACICGVLIGEGVQRLARLDSADAAGWISLSGGAGLALAAVVFLARSMIDRALAVVAVAIITGLVYVAYGQTVLD